MASRRRKKLGIGRSASRAFRGVNSRHFNKPARVKRKERETK